MKLEYEDLGLAQQVLERQGFEHLTRTKEYASQWCSISSSEMGGVFSAFLPINDVIVSTGTEVFEYLINAHQRSAQAMQNTINSYAKADEEAWQLLSQLANSVGVSVGDYSDPRDSIPTLGSAANRAGKYYGGGEPDVFTQAFQDGYSLGEFIDEQSHRIDGRIADFRSSNRGVQEEQDPQSYLATPESPTSEMENLRWSAGLILGSLDWAFEQLFGWSLLNDLVYKNLVGDWRYVDRAASAWGHIDDALVAVGQNDSAILPALSEWVGKGSEACNAFIAALAAATTGVSYAAGTVQGIVSKFAFVVKLAAKGIGAILKKISYKLARMAAEAAIPIVGWAAAAIECATLVDDIISNVRKAYKIVNFLYDAISGLIQAKAKMVEVAHTCANIAEAATRGSMVRL